MPFELLDSGHLPRRAFLIMPAVFGSLLFFSRRTERPLPDPTLNGFGPEVALVLFSDTGERLGAVEVRKIVKTERQWRAELWPEEFASTRLKATEFAFTGRYSNHHERGIYRCVCCGTALFRSEDKFDSGTGWPSFRAPIAPENVRTSPDRSLEFLRVEALCTKCDAHLGHVFDDGPAPEGLRYCINSVALAFRPLR